MRTSETCRLEIDSDHVVDVDGILTEDFRKAEHVEASSATISVTEGGVFQVEVTERAKKSSDIASGNYPQRVQPS